MIGVRYRGVDGFEGRCEGCLDYYPFDLEFWDPSRGLRTCRACAQAQKRLRVRNYRATPQGRAKCRASTKAYRERNREWLVPKQIAREHERVLMEPGYLERRRAYQREYMRRRRAAMTPEEKAAAREKRRALREVWRQAA